MKAVFEQLKRFGGTQADATSGVSSTPERLVMSTEQLNALVAAVDTGNFIRFLFRAIQDAANAGDTTTAAFYKALAERPSVADAAAKTFTRMLADMAAMSDVQAKAFQKAPTADLGTITDSLQATASFTRHFTDVVFASDAFGYLMSDGIIRVVAEDYVLLVDQIIKNAGQSPTADSAAFQDTRAYTLGAVRFDGVTVSSIYANTLTKVGSEGATVSDAGAVFNQGYGGPTYFAENYVGDLRTF